MTFKNEKDLIREVQRRSQAAFDKYVDAVQKVLQNETEDTVYAYQPRIYRRTYQFLNSVSAYKQYAPDKGVFRATVFFDPDKMNVGNGTFSKYSRGTHRTETWTYGIHADSQGRDVRRDIAKFLEEGHGASTPHARNTSGTIVGKHIYPARKGSYMIRTTNKWVRNEGDRALRVLLDKELGR